MLLNPFKRIGRRADTGTGAGAGDRRCVRRHHQRRLGRELVTNVGVGVGVPGSGGGSGEHAGQAAQRRATGDKWRGARRKGEGTVGDLSR